MIVIYHNHQRVLSMQTAAGESVAFDVKSTIAACLSQLAVRFPDSLLVWCDESCKEDLDLIEIPSLFHHKKLMLSYHPSESNYFSASIGYVEQSPFIKVNKNGTYPTWQMSSTVGGVHASVLIVMKEYLKPFADFDFFLNALAKVAMPKGLLCYSEPQLLKQNTDFVSTSKKANSFTLFRFVKQHYKTQWVFLLLLNLFLYERRFPFFAFLFSLFYTNRLLPHLDLEGIKVESTRKVIQEKSIDVIIPTIGRKKYLYEVLKDLAKQTHLPVNVIVVEQNPLKGSASELDYIAAESWPFKIKHHFTHQAGACNARNWALSEVESEWVFLADDDIRIESTFLENTMEYVAYFAVKAVTLRCYQKGETHKYHTVFQWGTFGSGCSLVFSESAKKGLFNMGYEFGFGEDGDFGMQLRNQGVDVLYLPEPEILHLKAPMGGFRTKPVLQWHQDSLQPKPSPTVMLYQLLNCTKEQTCGYKTTLFFKFYKSQQIKNPIWYYLNFQKQWERSVFWANELKKQDGI